MSTKIMLVSPPSYGNNLTMVNPFPTPPLGLCILKKELSKHEHNVRILDAAVVPFDFISFKKMVIDFKPNIIGMTTYYQNLNIIYLAKLIRSISKNIKIVIGGVVATKFGKLILETDNEGLIDFVITGSGILELVAIANENVENSKLFNKVNNGYINKKITYNNLLCNDLYLPNISPVLYKRFHYVFSSGCPFNCTFCVTAQQKPSNIFEVESIANEINLLYDVYGCNNFLLFDETLTINYEKLLKLSEKINNDNITFWGGTRSDCLNESVIKLLKKLNFNKLYIGIESTKPETQKFISNKAKNLQDIKEKIEMLHKYGIKVETSLLIGLPFESKEDFEKSLLETMELGFDYIMFSPIHIIPGSEIFINSHKYGYDFRHSAQNSYELFNQDNYVINGKGLASSQFISADECDILLKEIPLKLDYQNRFGKSMGYVKNILNIFPY